MPPSSVFNIERMKTVSFRNDVLPLKNELFRLALRITLNEAEAEDVVQETMIKVWNRRDDWGRIDSIEAFCLTVCRNLALDKAQKMDNRSEGLDGSGGDPSDDSFSADPERAAVLNDTMAILRRLMDSLPEKQRSVMHLRDVEGKSYKEIARTVCITEEQVKVNLFGARQKVKQKFLEIETYGL